MEQGLIRFHRRHGCKIAQAGAATLSGKLLLVWAVAGMCAVALPLPAIAPAQAQVARVPARPLTGQGDDRWKVSRMQTNACIVTKHIAGAVVVDERHIDFVMRGGRRFRMRLTSSCPQISYYGGIYYQMKDSGKLCAGQDKVMGRAGGSCRIRSIGELKLAR